VRIRRPTRREWIEKIAPFFDELRKKDLDEQKRHELNYEYEKALLRVCVVEPHEITECENPHDEVDGVILGRILGEIYDFCYVAPFLNSTQKPDERETST
ncbi:MAG: hypothetical protein QW544_02225, partial [Candidatus Caldarchaeum sp.]